MATTKILSVHPEPYRGGWDVTIEMSGVDRTINKTFHWPGKDQPDDKILAVKLQYFASQFDEPKEIEKVYTEKEVVDILVEKKYLDPGQKFTDLPTKATAEAVK